MVVRGEYGKEIPSSIIKKYKSLINEAISEEAKEFENNEYSGIFMDHLVF